MFLGTSQAKRRTGVQHHGVRKRGLVRLADSAIEVKPRILRSAASDGATPTKAQA